MIFAAGTVIPATPTEIPATPTEMRRNCRPIVGWDEGNINIRPERQAVLNRHTQPYRRPAADIVYLGTLQCNNATLLAYSPLQIVFATGAIRLALSRAFKDLVATPLA